MGLKKKVQASVIKAFEKLDSLMVPVVFSNAAATGFDFGSAAVTSEISVYATRGLKVNKKAYVEGNSITKLTIIVRTAGVVFSAYTTVLVDGTRYNCCVMESDDYVTTLELKGTS